MILEAESKHYSGLCICQDEIFINTFWHKWRWVYPYKQHIYTVVI